MLVLIWHFAVGRFFMSLASSYDKPRWVFGIVGCALSWIGSALAYTFLILELGEQYDVVKNIGDSLKLKFLAVIISTVFCYGVYSIIKQIWSQQQKTDNSSDTLDQDL